MRDSLFDELFNIDDDLPSIRPIGQVDSCHASPRCEIMIPEINLHECSIKKDLDFFQSESIDDSSKRKVGRPRGKKVLCTEEKKELRAEKNRKYAKDSRERKRKYIENLEEQVKQLKKELEIYKNRLRKYELIEKHENSMGYEIYNTMVSTYKFLHENNISTTDKNAFASILRQERIKAIEEEGKALEQLTKEIIEVAMPFPRRVAIRIAEDHINIYDPEAVKKIIGPSVSLEQAKVIIEYLKEMCPDEKARNEMMIFTTVVGKRIKTKIREIVAAQKEIQIELKTLIKRLKQGKIANFDPHIMESLAMLSTQIAMKPEWSKLAICQLDDTDFGIGDLNLDNNEPEGEDKYIGMI